MTAPGPRIDEIREFLARHQPLLHRTPVVRCSAIERALDGIAEVSAKLEFLQRTGTFKARGALATLFSLSGDELARGVTAVSAGNHAIATAFAAQAAGTTAKVVMPKSANPSRVEACQSFGGEVVTVDDVHEAFARAADIEESEGRYFAQPFEGPQIAIGTGSVGLEIVEQAGDFDMLVVPVGGGGLMAGIANAVKQLNPSVEIVGVEPTGADTMHRSFAAGKPEKIEKVQTIADSLGAPFALPYSFGLCNANVDRLVRISDDELRDTMGFLFRSMSLALEPACVATTAALLGPLRDSLEGRRIVIVMCGSNIDWATFAAQARFR